MVINVALTGAAGYVGSVLAQGLRHADFHVIEFRRNPRVGFADDRPFQLQGDHAAENFAGIDVLVHCAYDFKAHGWEKISAINVEGTRRLFAAAANAGIKRFVLISSISAFAGCRSLYGRAKLEMEAIAIAHGGTVIRPGLVFGERPGGMVAALAKLTSLPVLTPLVGDGSHLLYPVHEEDLCRLLIRTITSDAGGFDPRPIIAAYHPGYRLREIMLILGKMQGRQLRFIPIPAGCIDLGLRLLEWVGVRPRLRRDSLLSMLNPDPAPDFSALERWGVRMRPFTPVALTSN